MKKWSQPSINEIQLKMTAGKPGAEGNDQFIDDDKEKKLEECYGPTGSCSDCPM